MEAVSFIGLQGPGKMSFYKEHFFSTHLRISLDLLRTRNRERKFLATAKKLERPSMEEGGDELRYVRLTDSGFVLEQWKDEVR